MASAAAELTLHASCVAWGGRGLLILGSSGAGKSSLALELMAFGCDLVSDDRTTLRADGNALVANAPAAIAGQIEARWVGILSATPALPARLVLAIDLDQVETDRLPLQRSVTFIDVSIPLILRPHGGHLGAAVLQYLKAGRNA